MPYWNASKRRTKKEPAEVAERSKRTPSIVLEFPPEFDIEKRDPITGTIGTAASTRASTTQESSMVTQRFEIQNS
jgi:hypothetical protein